MANDDRSKIIPRRTPECGAATSKSGNGILAAKASALIGRNRYGGHCRRVRANVSVGSTVLKKAPVFWAWFVT
jgi:hypothetical protein